MLPSFTVSYHPLSSLIVTYCTRQFNKNLKINRGEGRYSVSRFICHGQRGEIRKRYREGQEDQLNALGLVSNAVVLWNTPYIEAALEQLKARGATIKDNDVARLSPLMYRHINVLGRSTFSLAELVANGKLRPLNHFDDKGAWGLE